MLIHTSHHLPVCANKLPTRSLLLLRQVLIPIALSEAQLQDIRKWVTEKVVLSKPEVFLEQYGDPGKWDNMTLVRFFSGCQLHQHKASRRSRACQPYIRPADSEYADFELHGGNAALVPQCLSSGPGQPIARVGPAELVLHVKVRTPAARLAVPHRACSRSFAGRASAEDQAETHVKQAREAEKAKRLLVRQLS